MNSPYSVTLCDADDLSPARRIAAELRFVKELEKNLGGAEAVVRVYRAWGDVSESEASEIDHTTANLAMKWPRAFDLAQRAVLEGMGNKNAHFEIHPERHAFA